MHQLCTKHKLCIFYSYRVAALATTKQQKAEKLFLMLQTVALAVLDKEILSQLATYCGLSSELILIDFVGVCVLNFKMLETKGSLVTSPC